MLEPPPNTPDATAARRHWISVLSRSTANELERHWAEAAVTADIRILRAPETGLVMVRGRAGGSGRRFNAGETTVTRCAVMLSSGEKGHGWVLGRDGRHARLAAMFDACLQRPELHRTLMDKVIIPVERAQQQARLARRGKVAATKVDFYTMVRGEDG